MGPCTAYQSMITTLWFPIPTPANRPHGLALDRALQLDVGSRNLAIGYRPPPSGLAGAWSDGKRQEVKDRQWIFPLRPDGEREEILRIKDAAVVRRLREMV